MRTIDISSVVPEKYRGETIHHNYTDSQYYTCSNGDLTCIQEVQLRDKCTTNWAERLVYIRA